MFPSLIYQITVVHVIKMGGTEVTNCCPIRFFCHFEDSAVVGKCENGTAFIGGSNINTHTLSFFCYSCLFQAATLKSTDLTTSLGRKVRISWIPYATRRQTWVLSRPVWQHLYATWVLSTYVPAGAFILCETKTGGSHVTVLKTHSGCQIRDKRMKWDKDRWRSCDQAIMQGAECKRGDGNQEIEIQNTCEKCP